MGPPVGKVVKGEFHNEGRSAPPEEDAVQHHPGGRQDEKGKQNQHPGDRQCGPAEEGRRQEGDDRQARCAGHQGGQENGQQAGPPGFNHPRPQNRRDVAPEAQEQGQEGLPVQPHPVHHAVHHVGRAGHIAHVLQKGQRREEEGQDGQEDQHGSHATENRRRSGAPPARSAQQGSAQPIPPPPVSPTKSSSRF